MNAGYSQASDLLGQGRQAATTQYGNATAAFAPFLATGGAGTQAYADATGANGTAGQTRAKANFQTDPGYQFQLDQGNENILRNQARTGQLNSGATNVDLLNYGQGQAQQQYGNYINRLQPFLSLGQSAATGTAGVDTGLGNVLNNSYGTQGNVAYNTQTGIGNANADADLAGLTASGNDINALMAGGKLAANLAPFLLSDIRAKDDIEPVGKLYDGQDVYRYRYKGDSRHQIGLLAQEVEQIDPEAVADLGGFKGVDYRRATEHASRLAEFL